jgi:hypothetical protein
MIRPKALREANLADLKIDKSEKYYLLDFSICKAYFMDAFEAVPTGTQASGMR